MKTVYCSNCGYRLGVAKKVFKKQIIEVVDFHICLATPIEPDVTPLDVPAYVPSEKSRQIPTQLEDPGDRRSPDHIKQGTSAAPLSLLEHLKMRRGDE